MHEHFIHYFLSFIPFFVLLIWVIKNNFNSLKSIFALTALISFLIFQALPFHSIHAVHFADQSNHQCCLPTAVTPVVTFEIILPDKIIAETYIITEELIETSTPFFNPGRSPPTA